MSKPKPRSAAAHPSKKGGRFEREVAMALSVWYGDAPGTPHTERSFRRSPGSGGIDPHEWPGDVIPTRLIAHRWPLVVECKASDSEFGDLIELLTAPRHPLFGWVERVRREALGVGRHWWLVVRRVHYPWLLFMDGRTWMRLAGAMAEGAPMEREPFFRFRPRNEDAPSQFLAVCLFDAFMASITPDELRGALPIKETRYG